VRARREQDAPRLDGPRALAVFDEHDRRAPDRHGARPREQLDTRPLRRPRELAAAQVVAAERLGPRDAEARAGLLEDLPAEGRPLVGEGDAQPGESRLGAGGEARRPAADDKEVDRAAQRQAGIGGSGAPIVAL
jgi:hypothetical protein